jgi:hypothetical protein
MTTPLPPQEIEKICHGPSDPQKFYSCTIGCNTAWYGNCLASDCKTLQRVMCTAQDIPGAELHAIQDLYTMRCQRRDLTRVVHCHSAVKSTFYCEIQNALLLSSCSPLVGFSKDTTSVVVHFNKPETCCPKTGCRFLSQVDKGLPANLKQLWEALESTWTSIPVERF